MKDSILSLTILLASFAVVPMIGICEDNRPSDTLSKLQGGTVWTGAAVSPALQKAWADNQKTGDNSQKVQCIIVLRNPAISKDRANLLISGFMVKSLEGTTGQGDIFIKDLPRVATNPIIKSIRLATE